MTKISKEEVLKIAHISNIMIHNDEIDLLMQELQDVLTYAERVAQVDGDAPESELKMTNVDREDIIVGTDAQKILSLVPDRVGDYFVVPLVVEQN